MSGRKREKERNYGKRMIAWLLAIALVCPHQLPVFAEELNNEGVISQDIVPQSPEEQYASVGTEAPEAYIPADENASGPEEGSETVSLGADMGISEASQELPEETADVDASTDTDAVNPETEIRSEGTAEGTDAPDSAAGTSGEGSAEDTAAPDPAAGTSGEASEEDPSDIAETADDFEELLSDGSEQEEELLTSELSEVGATVSGVSYIGEDGQPATAASCTVVEEDIITWKDGWYVVYENITIKSRVKVKKGVHLILADGATLTIPKGIEVNRSSTNELHIYVQAEGSGVLNAGGSCSMGNAGIGGASGMAGGPVYINGGTVSAAGGDYAAGIGGGMFSDGTLIQISGGDVTAKGGSQGAGIGGGYQGGCELLTISGGTITAIAGVTLEPFNKASQAIGSGQDPQATSGNISFVLYDGAELHAGADADHTTIYLNDQQGIQACRDNPYVRISRTPEGVRFINKEGDEWLLSQNLYQKLENGTSRWADSWYLVSGTVSIPNRVSVSGDVSLILGDGAELKAMQGITVNEGSSLKIYGQKEQTGILYSDASGKYDAAGIGSENAGKAGTIELYGGNITVLGGNKAPGIGSSSGDQGQVLIGRGVVDAVGGMDGAGIGGCSAVDIQGGTVTAAGKDGGAGIGGNASQSGNKIRISGGKVTASGGDKGAGIGSGKNASGNEVTVIQGEITATGGEAAAGIGGGDGGAGGYISITGGTVTAKGGTNGIGGGRNGDCGSVDLYGGTVLALGSNGSSVGGKTFDSSKIRLGEVQVASGNDESGLTPVNVLPRQDTRADAFKNPCAKASLCTEHEKTEGYMYDEKAHCHICSHCAKQLDAEVHQYMTYDPKPDEPSENYPYKEKDEDHHTRECEICHYIQEGFHEYSDSDSVNCSLCGGGMILVSYMDTNGNIRTHRGCRLIHGAKGASGEVNEMNNDSYDGFYLVRGSVTVQKRIQVEGKVNLVLADKASLTAEQGIHVAEGSTLTIWGQEDQTGSITAGIDASLSLMSGKAGIGGDSCENGGVIIVNGGMIEANGGSGAAGIGSGSFEDDPASVIYIDIPGSKAKLPVYKTGAVGNDITIHKGVVRAVGGNNAAAIGGGASCPGGKITIDGGRVYATGKGRGAGIGGGEYAHGGNIMISGGQVEATASGTGSPVKKDFPVPKYTGSGDDKMITECGAAIGGGSEGYQDMMGAFTRITIRQGTIVKAHAHGNAAAIGQGFAIEGNLVDTEIHITGGQTTAISDGGCPLGTFETKGMTRSQVKSGEPTRKCKTSLRWYEVSDYLDLQGTDFYGRTKSLTSDELDCYNQIDLQMSYRDRKTGETFSRSTGNFREETSAWTILNRLLIPVHTCIVSFDGNGASTFDPMKDDTASLSQNYKLPVCRFTAPAGKYFTGWKVSWNGRIMKPGETLYIDEANYSKNLTLTAQWGDSYNIWVGNVLVTADNCTDVLGDGKVSYDPKKKILKLDHVNGIKMQTPTDESNMVSNQRENLAMIAAKGMNLIIEFDDTSLVSEDKVRYGIIVQDGSLVIRPADNASSRKLTVESKDVAIHADSNLTIQDVTDLKVVSVSTCGLRSNKDIILKKNSLKGTDRLRYSVKSYSAIEAGGDILISDISLLQAEASNKYYGCSIKGKNVRIARNSSYTEVTASGGNIGIAASQQVYIEDSYAALSGNSEGLEAKDTVIKGTNSSCSVTASGNEGIKSANLTIENAFVDSAGTNWYGITAYENMHVIWSDPENARMQVRAKTGANMQAINFKNLEIDDKLKISVPKDAYIAHDMSAIRSRSGESVNEIVISPMTLDVSFDPNGGSGEMAPRAVEYTDEFSFPSCSFAPPSPGKEFTGWKVGDQIYNEGDSIQILKEVTAVAQWDDLNWQILQKKLKKGGTIVLYNDVKADVSNDSCLISDKDTILDLNGHKIDRNRNAFEFKDRSVIRVTRGSLTIRDSAGGGKITGGNPKENGGGVYVDRGTLTLESGAISGNSAPYYGAGVFVNHGTFIMKGGEISGNVSNMTGGAVFVMNSDAEFRMSGGRITGNTGLFGAAVNCHEGRFYVSGSPVITGNIKDMGLSAKGYDITYAGYFLPSAYRPIYVSGPLTEEARIEVSNSDTSHMVITKGLSGKGSAGAFISENSNYKVSLNRDGEAVLAKLRKITFYADPEGKKILQEEKLEPDASLAAYEDLSDRLQVAGFDHWVYLIPGSGDKEFKDADLSSMKMPDSDIAFYPFVNPWAALQEQLEQGGTIGLSEDIIAMPSDTCLIIEKDTVIDLKGRTIDRNLDFAEQDGMVFKVEGGSLTIMDSVGGGKITGGNTTGSGGAIRIGHGNVTLTGGEISGNKAGKTGGAVYMENSDASFTMTGGMITGNHSNSEGAVSGKNAESIFAVSGAPVITGNTFTSKGGIITAGAGYDVSADGSSPIRILGPLSQNAKIEVISRSRIPAVVSQGLPGNGNASVFVSADPGYGIRTDKAGEAELAIMRQIIFRNAASITGKVVKQEKVVAGASLASFAGFTVEKSGYRFAYWFYYPENSKNSTRADLSTMEMPDYNLTLFPVFEKETGSSGTSGGSYSSGGSYRYSSSYSSASAGTTSTTDDSADDGSPAASENTEPSFAKVLLSVNDMNVLKKDDTMIIKAHYGEEDDATAAEIYVLEKEVPLEENVLLDQERLARYRLWNNALTMHDVYLLPNAARLYATQKPDYVSDTIRGDVKGDGGEYDIDIITALNKWAFKQPQIPVGSIGSLRFDTGVLMLPSLVDYELFLHEVSASWMKELMDNGMIRMISAEQDDVNKYALDGKKEEGNALPAGEVLEGLTEYDGEFDRIVHQEEDKDMIRKGYWLGATPETATEDDQTLIFLLVNENTDEIDAFRTSISMLDAGEEGIDVSLYLYRDSKSDRQGVEKYNVMFFDTPEGEKSLFKVITNVLEDRVLALPRNLNIRLRSFDLGADLPSYSLSDHFFAMNDGTPEKKDPSDETEGSDDRNVADNDEEKVGRVSMFDGFYQAAFDGNVFESSYMRIEGIKEGDLTVILRSGQNIWPEWTGEDSAEDIQKCRYVRTDGVWERSEEEESDSDSDKAER